MMHIPTPSQEKLNDCYFFYYSTCKKGSQCPFRHFEGALGTEITCKHWLVGTCQRLDCPYRHMQIDKRRTNTPCFWENQPGGCRKPHCVFMHLKPRNEQGTIEATPLPIMQYEPPVQMQSSLPEREGSPEDDDLDGAIVIQPVQALRIPSGPIAANRPLILPSIEMQDGNVGIPQSASSEGSSSDRIVIPNEKPIRPKKVIRRPRNDARYIIDKVPAPPNAVNDLREKLKRKTRSPSPSPRLETEEELDAGLEEYNFGLSEASGSGNSSLVDAILSSSNKSSDTPKPVKLRKRWTQGSCSDGVKKPRVSFASQDSTEALLKDVLGKSLDEEDIDEEEALGEDSLNNTTNSDLDSKTASLLGKDLAAQLKEQGIELDLDGSGDGL